MTRYMALALCLLSSCRTAEPAQVASADGALGSSTSAAASPDVLCASVLEGSAAVDMVISRNLASANSFHVLIRHVQPGDPSANADAPVIVKGDFPGTVTQAFEGEIDLGSGNAIKLPAWRNSSGVFRTRGDLTLKIGQDDFSDEILCRRPPN